MRVKIRILKSECMLIHLLQVMKECFRELKALHPGEKGLGAGDAEEDEEEDAGE